MQYLEYIIAHQPIWNPVEISDILGQPHILLMSKVISHQAHELVGNEEAETDVFLVGGTHTNCNGHCSRWRRRCTILLIDKQRWERGDLEVILVSTGKVSFSFASLSPAAAASSSLPKTKNAQGLVVGPRSLNMTVLLTGRMEQVPSFQILILWKNCLFFAVVQMGTRHGDFKSECTRSKCISDVHSCIYV